MFIEKEDFLITVENGKPISCSETEVKLLLPKVLKPEVCSLFVKERHWQEIDRYERPICAWPRFVLDQQDTWVWPCFWLGLCTCQPSFPEPPGYADPGGRGPGLGPGLREDVGNLFISFLFDKHPCSPYF